MAKPIEPTPILENEDAEAVLKELESTSHSAEKAAFLKKCKEIYDSTQR